MSRTKGEPKRFKLTHAEAFIVYAELGSQRSLPKLGEILVERYGKSPHQSTLRAWSSREHWARRAQEWDENVARKLEAQVTASAVEEGFSEVIRFRGLQKSALDEIDKLFEAIKNAQTPADPYSQLERLTKIAKIAGERIDKVTSDGRNTSGDAEGAGGSPDAAAAALSDEKLLESFMRSVARRQAADERRQHDPARVPGAGNTPPRAEPKPH
jgi:hypothetical protein